MIINKTQKWDEKVVTYVYLDRTCSYCKNPGHGANRCTENPNRDTRCQRCDNMGLSEDTCWERRNTEIETNNYDDWVNLTMKGNYHVGSACLSSSGSNSYHEAQGTGPFSIVVDEDYE